MDVRLALARDLHRSAKRQVELARRDRRQRDRLVRELRAEDPGWTYESLAHAVGCSPELIAFIVKNEVPDEEDGEEAGE